MTTSNTVLTLNDSILAALPYCLQETNFTFGKKYRGKVRDTYELDDKLILITTDRLSAFDRSLALIPFKGQVLNLVSAYWFQQTEDANRSRTRPILPQQDRGPILFSD